MESGPIEGLGRTVGKTGIPVALKVAGKRFWSSRRCRLQVELRVYPPETAQASPIAVSMLALAWKERGFSKLGEKPMTFAGAGLTPGGSAASVFGNCTKFSTVVSN